MKHYYVKARFSGWHKVNEEHFNAFVQNIKNGAQNMSDAEKDEYIKTITRIEEDENGLA